MACNSLIMAASPYDAEALCGPDEELRAGR